MRIDIGGGFERRHKGASFFQPKFTQCQAIVERDAGDGWVFAQIERDAAVDARGTLLVALAIQYWITVRIFQDVGLQHRGQEEKFGGNRGIRKEADVQIDAEFGILWIADMRGGIALAT